VDRRPALPVEVDQDPTRIRIDTRTGERYREIEAIYTEYDLGRIRAGYCCIECGEAHEVPFPKNCVACHFPMSDEQAKKFGESFEGPTTIGPSRSIEELRAEDEEKKARARYAETKPTSQIWIPGA